MAGENRELYLYVACNAFVCAIPIAQVDRLLLDADVERLTTESAVRLINVAGRTYGSFNLGRLFGMKPSVGAHVLLRVRHGGGVLPVAIETGACIVVRAPGQTTTLPKALFRTRRRAIRGAMVLDASIKREEFAGVGLTLNVDELLTPTERQALYGALRAAASPAPTPP